MKKETEQLSEASSISSFITKIDKAPFMTLEQTMMEIYIRLKEEGMDNIPLEAFNSDRIEDDTDLGAMVRTIADILDDLM
jgi:hypothetical protein